MCSPEARYAPIAPDYQADGRRMAGSRILNNRGLTRARNKDRKTPKTANRHKYDQATKKRRSQVQEYKEKQGSYGGEKTGIKTNLVKSTSLKQ